MKIEEVDMSSFKNERFKYSERKIMEDYYFILDYYKLGQFFGFDVATAMKTFSDYIPALKDCAPTVTFTLRVHNLIKAMNSRYYKGALQQNSPEMKV